MRTHAPPPSYANPTALSLHTPLDRPAVAPGAANAFGLGSFRHSRLASEYRLLERLGQGGGGSVVRAQNLIDGNYYALKRITFWVRSGESHSESAAQLALREVQALARLNHPHVCRYYSAWIETDWAASFEDASFFQSNPPIAHNAAVGQTRFPLLKGVPVDLMPTDAGSSGHVRSTDSRQVSSGADAVASTIEQGGAGRNKGKRFELAPRASHQEGWDRRRNFVEESDCSWDTDELNDSADGSSFSGVSNSVQKWIPES